MLVGLDGVLMEAWTAAPSGEDALEMAVLRVRAGEAGAFEALMALTDRHILGIAWRLLGDRDQARDAAQEVYLRIHRSIASYRPGQGFRPWMHRITVNVCFDHLRKRGPFMDAFEEAQDSVHARADVAHPEETLLLEQRKILLRRALGSLTPAERAALVLRDIEGLSTEETAAALGVRPATVRSQISAARAKVQAFCARRSRAVPGGRP